MANADVLAKANHIFALRLAASVGLLSTPLTIRNRPYQPLVFIPFCLLVSPTL
jgi:hypothetical protein